MEGGRTEGLSGRDELRRITLKTRRDRIRNEVIRRELGLTETLVNRISKRRLTWFGHLVRMEDNSCWPKAQCCYVDGKKEQRKRIKDMDGKRETRPYRNRHGLENGTGYYQRQRKL